MILLQILFMKQWHVFVCVSSLQVSPLLNLKPRGTPLWSRSSRWVQVVSAALCFCGGRAALWHLCLPLGQPRSFPHDYAALSKKPRLQAAASHLHPALSRLHTPNHLIHSDLHQSSNCLSSNWRGTPSLLWRPPHCGRGVHTVERQQGQSQRDTKQQQRGSQWPQRDKTDIFHNNTE